MKKTLLVFLLLPSLTFAAFKGSIEFTPQEYSEHQTDIHTIIPAATECLNVTFAHHLAFHRRYGISPYFGDQSKFGKMTLNERKAFLRSIRKDEDLVHQMRPISCVGLAMKCLSEGFAAAGKTPIWKRLEAHLKLNAVDGTALQYSLRKLGWKTLYWNPNLDLNALWDSEEKARNPENIGRSWGYHVYRWATIQKNSMYYHNYVDDKSTLVNFGTRPPKRFKQLPFYLGTAHTGYHVFPGSYGQVIESHSMRDIRDVTTVESSEFNPLTENGGPQGTMYSGLIAIPPGHGI
jgi:hypothetical protein